MKGAVVRKWLAPTVLLAGAGFVVAVVWHTLLSDTEVGVRGAALLATTQGLVLLLAARQPVPAWSVAVVLLVAATAWTGRAPWEPAMYFSYLAVAGVAAYRAGRLVGAALWSATVLSGVVFTAVRGGSLADLLTLSLLAGLVVVAAVSVRGLFDARVSLSQERAAAERHRRQRLLLEERARIARELHDVVAHHMSVIALHAEAAQYRVPDPPPELQRSFVTIRASAVAALTEMRSILAVLRAEAGDGGATAAAARDNAAPPPQPGLAQLAELIEQAQGTGAPITLSVVGAERALPGGLELSVFRIVQESMSNALRHAPGAAILVRVDYGQQGLAVTIDNGPARPGLRRGQDIGSPTDVGHGLVGMRERAAMLSGTLDAQPTPDGGFCVRAWFPLAQEEVR